MSRGTTDWNRIRETRKSELAVWLADRVLAQYEPDLSITQLSGIVGVSGTALWRYVNLGNRASDATIRKIATVLGDLDGGLAAGGYAASMNNAVARYGEGVYHDKGSAPDMVALFSRLAAFADITRLDSTDQRRLREHLDLLLSQPKYSGG